MTRSGDSRLVTPRARARLVAVSAAVALPAVLLGPPASSSAAPAAPARAVTTATTPKPATTSAIEKKRVDGVPTPKLGWYSCFGYAQCATVALPLDYDAPKGPKVEVAVLRVKARKPAQKIGSLFLNPGGPGGSGVDIALAAPAFLSDSVLDRFDVVGFDPRGTGFSQNVRCFRNSGAQNSVFALKQGVPFPVTPQEEKGHIAAARALGRACSTTGKPLSASVSTAEVVRDMEVLRRAVGDKKLTFMGFSYGTAVASFAANMFPDRFRAIVADGVINPVNYVGTARTQNVVMDDRLRTADGTYKAFTELLRRCDAAGRERCAFATGDALKSFDELAERLKANPLQLQDPETGPFLFRYQTLVNVVNSALYSTSGTGQTDLVKLLADLLTLTEPGAQVPAAAEAAAARRVAVTVAAQRKARQALLPAPGRDFPYSNGTEHYSAVLCTDGLHPADAASWPARVAAYERRAPHFGRLWGYATQPCARDTWTAQDEDAYRGPFTKRTAAPVMYVGNAYDPATPQIDAETTSRLLPNSALVTSDSWGHTAYRTSACVTDAVDRFLLTGRPTSKTLKCVGDWQPFTTQAGPTVRRQVADARALAKAGVMPPKGAPKQLPPVVGRMPLTR